jgi:arylformamidase
MSDLRIIADLSIPLRFDGPQPNAYGVEPATAAACEYGELIGDTRRGGSCNFERVTLIPHCNGTHTECVGHIVNERISVRDCLQDVLIPAVLLSVEPEPRDEDMVIGREALSRELPGEVPAGSALIVRTLPNDESKLSRVYAGGGNMPPYFTADGMRLIVEYGFTHLLVDLPSIDRLFDEGKLSNHRKFWNVEAESREVNGATRIGSTITELIYVPNEVPDGEYLLNLQIAPFAADAAPSRPLLLDRVL